MTEDDNSTTGDVSAGAESHREAVAAATRQAEMKTSTCKCDQRNYFCKPENWVSLATLIAVAIYTAITFYILRNSERQAQTISNQLVLASPPKLLVTNVAIWPATGKPGDPVDLVPKAAIKGKAWLVNVGAEPTTLGIFNPPFDSTPVCVTFWNVGPLPMARPYDVPLPNTKPCNFLQLDDGKQITSLRPGEFGYWPFEVAVPDGYTSAMDFYVLGYVIHHDRLGVRHLTLFARKYDLGERRFKAVEGNHDYEGYE
jgi:hypothetical protein